MDKLKDDLEMIVDSLDLIHSKTFMMGLLSEWEKELPEFKKHWQESIENKIMYYFNAPGKDKVCPRRS